MPHSDVAKNILEFTWPGHGAEVLGSSSILPTAKITIANFKIYLSIRQGMFTNDSFPVYYFHLPCASGPIINGIHLHFFFLILHLHQPCWMVHFKCYSSSTDNKKKKNHACNLNLILKVFLHLFKCSVGRPKHVRVMAGALEGDIFIGPKAEEHRGLLSIKYPMEVTI